MSNLDVSLPSVPACAMKSSESVMVLTVLGGSAQSELEHRFPLFTVFNPDPIPVQLEPLIWCHLGVAQTAGNSMGTTNIVLNLAKHKRGG